MSVRAPLKIIMKLCIDPGHGLSNSKTGVYDPGACSGVHQEATIVLIWAHALRCACEAKGIPVWMTRHDRGDAAPVGTRATRAKAAGCTHFISLHLNASDSPQSNGVETIYEGVSKIEFAAGIQRLLVSSLVLRNRGVKSASQDLKRTLAVLRFSGPAALLELGFVTNEADRNKVMDAKVMHATCKVLAEHLAADHWGK